MFPINFQFLIQIKDSLIFEVLHLYSVILIDTNDTFHLNYQKFSIGNNEYLDYQMLTEYLGTFGFRNLIIVTITKDPNIKKVRDYHYICKNTDTIIKILYCSL